MRDKLSQKADKMSSAEAVQDEISTLLRKLADPVQAGESVKACIRRASMRSGLPHGQTRKLWYREIKLIPAHVADHIRRTAADHDRKLKKSMFQALAAMQESDPDYYRECIEEVGNLLFQARSPVGADRRSD